MTRRTRFAMSRAEYPRPREAYRENDEPVRICLAVQDNGWTSRRAHWYAPLDWLRRAGLRVPLWFG